MDALPDSGITTAIPSSLHSGPAPASLLPPPVSVQVVGRVCSTALALGAMSLVAYGWLIARLIPDWRYAVGALILIAYPADAIRLIQWLVERRPTK